MMYNFIIKKIHFAAFMVWLDLHGRNVLFLKKSIALGLF